MKLFIRILLFVLAVFVTNVKVASAAIVFPNTQEAIEYSSFIPEATKVVFKAVENDLANCCQNGNDLVNYRDWGKGVEAVATKTGSKIAVQFGKTENQIYHAFRHTDALGLDHIIPNAVYKLYKKELKKMGYIQNNAKNLKKLSVPFHGNHPAYNKTVDKLLGDILNSGGDLKDVMDLQKTLRHEINDKVKEGHSTLNEAFK